MKLHVLASTLAACIVCSAQAQPDAKALDEFTQRFKAANPGTRIDSIAVSPITGLYEVVMGKNVAYVEPSGRYALFGHVWDMQNRRDLTADRKAELDKVDVAALPRNLALRHVRGKGTRTLYVFADPQCGYCKQLEQTLMSLDDVTVHTFLTPVLGPESKRLSLAITCAADPAAAWHAWMLQGKQPVAKAGCEANAEEIAKVEAVEKLAQSLGINGTPTLVAGDGRKQGGAIPGPQLAAWLAEGAAAAAASKAAQTAAAVPSSAKTAPR